MEMEIETGSGNVYADLGRPDAALMLVKAQLVTKLSALMAHRKLTQREAADLIELPQPKLSNILRGQFRGVSEAKMMECLTRMGRDVEIVVKAAKRSRTSGQVSVVFV